MTEWVHLLSPRQVSHYTHHAGNVAVLTEELAQSGHLDVSSPGRGGEVWPGGQPSHSQQSGALISVR